MTNKVEATVDIHGRVDVPNYVVCYVMSKEDLYDLANCLYDSQAFIIPIYTKEVKDVSDFSDAHLLDNSQYLIKPFYAGNNPELTKQYVSKTVDMMKYEDERLFFKGVEVISGKGD